MLWDAITLGVLAFGIGVAIALVLGYRSKED